MPSRDSAGVSRTQLSSGTWAAVPPSARCCSGDSWKSWYEPSSADVIRAGLAPILLCATAAGNQRMVVDGSETKRGMGAPEMEVGLLEDLSALQQVQAHA